MSDSDLSHQDVIPIELHTHEKPGEDQGGLGGSKRDPSHYSRSHKGAISPPKEMFIPSHQYATMTSPLSEIQVESTRFHEIQQDRSLSTATVTSGLLTFSHSSATIMMSHEGIMYRSPLSVSRQNSMQPGQLVRQSSRGTPRSPLRKIDDYFPVKSWLKEKPVSD